MPSEFQHKRTVAFAETDLAGIVHFSRYFIYMEDAEHAFLRSIGLTVHTEKGDHAIGFPRISARCEFLRPLRFEDEVETCLWVVRRGPKSVTYHFEILTGGRPVARGESVVLCCRWECGGKMEACLIPPDIAARIEESSRPPIEFGKRSS